MWLRYLFWVAVFGITLVAGLVIGFNIGVLLEQQQLTQSGIAITVISLLGMVISISGLLRTWNKDRKEEAKIPVLEFGDIVSTQETLGGQFAGYIVDTIAVRVKKSKGMGKAQQCEGFISVPETQIPSNASPWLHERVRNLDIGGEAFLTLFHLDRVPEISGLILSFISVNNEIAQVRMPRAKVDPMKIRIELQSVNAKNPAVIEKPIQDIINEAKKFH